MFPTIFSVYCFLYHGHHRQKKFRITQYPPPPWHSVKFSTFLCPLDFVQRRFHRTENRVKDERSDKGAKKKESEIIRIYFAWFSLLASYLVNFSQCCVLCPIFHYSSGPSSDDFSNSVWGYCVTLQEMLSFFYKFFFN